MAPKAFKPVPDLKTAVPPATEAEVTQAAIDVILEQTPHHTIQKLASGTIRTDRLTATAAELEAERREKILRREQRCIAQGSADTDNVPQNF